MYEDPCPHGYVPSSCAECRRPDLVRLYDEEHRGKTRAQLEARRAQCVERAAQLEGYEHPSQAQRDEFDALQAETIVIGHLITRDDVEIRRAKIEEIRRAAMDPANCEAGYDPGHREPAGRPGAPALVKDARHDRLETPQEVISRAGDVWHFEGGPLAGRETPSGYIARAHSAVEAMESRLSRGGAGRLGELLAEHERGPVWEDRTLVDVVRSAELVLALSSPWYESAFRHILRDPVAFRMGMGHLRWSDEEREAFTAVELVRASFAESSGVTGAYLLPLVLDDTILLVDSGVASPFRRYATSKMTSSNTWNGVTASPPVVNWVAEGSVVSDTTPAVAALVITPWAEKVWVTGSLEITQDTHIAEQLPRLIQAGRDVLEVAAFTTGSGSGQPWGLVTRGTSDAATGALANTHVYGLHSALPPRFRNGDARPLWMANVANMDACRQLIKGTGQTQSIVDDGQADNIAEMLSIDFVENSAMSALNTTGAKNLLLADMSQAILVDRIGTEVIYEPLIKDQATMNPKGQVGWFAVARCGLDVTTGTAFRYHTC